MAILAQTDFDRIPASLSVRYLAGDQGDKRIIGLQEVGQI